MDKPIVPKKITTQSIREKHLEEKRKKEKIENDSADEYNYQMPRDSPRTLRKKNSLSQQITTERIRTPSPPQPTPLPEVQTNKNLILEEEQQNQEQTATADNDDFLDNEEYFSNYSHLNEMTSKQLQINDPNEDKNEYYKPKLPPKSVINSINKNQNYQNRMQQKNEDLYEYTYCQVFQADLDSNGKNARATAVEKKTPRKSTNSDDYYRRSKILSSSRLLSNVSTSTLLSNLEELISDKFLTKTDLELLEDYNRFEAQIYSNSSNLKCADCKSSKPNWISCRFFITLCNQCAYIHSNFAHEHNIYYLIEINKLFSGTATNYTKLCIVKLLNEIGNEKFNLLIEQNSHNQAVGGHENDESYSREYLIKEKYFNSKPFLDEYDLNLQLFTNIQGSCVALTAYNIYDNLNTTLSDYRNERSLLDQAVCSNQNLQVAYLYLNNFKTYSYLFSSIGNLMSAYKQPYIGELTVCYDKKKPVTSVMCQLDYMALNLGKINVNIELNFVQLMQKINENEIEIEYLVDEEQQQHSKSLSLNFNYQSELILWKKELLKKLICNYLNYDLSLNRHKLVKLNRVFDLINSSNYEIKYAGCLTLIGGSNQQQQQESYNEDDVFNQDDSGTDDDEDDIDDDDTSTQLNPRSKCIAFICVSKYDEFIFKRDLVLIHLKSYHNVIISHLDLRKLLRLKRNLETLLISIDMPMNKSFTFKFSTSRQLTEWFNELNRACEFDEFTSLEMQYLNKSNIPLIIEQCLHFMQINGNSFIPQQQAQVLNLDSKQQKFIESLIVSLEKNKFYNLFNITIEPNINLDKNLLGYLIIQQFLKQTFVFPKYLFESIMKNLYDNAKLSEIFSSFLLNTYNLVFYSTFKFILMNLYIFLSLKRAELDDDEYNRVTKNLISVFSKLIFHLQTLNYDADELNRLLSYLIENLVEIFQINKSYLKRQFKIIEKSIQISKTVNMKMASLNYTTVSPSNDDYFDNNNHQQNRTSSSNATSNSNLINFLITIFAFHDNSEQSFQLNINKKFKTKQAIEQTKHKYTFIESKYWCLTEVLDINDPNGNKTNIYLERILPVNASLLDSLSKWNKSFYICFKVNEIEANLKRIKTNDLLTTCDKCSYIYLLNTYQNLNFNNKLKAAFISLQKSVISIYKNIKQKDLYNDEFSNSGHGDNDAFNMDKPLIQMNIENCLVYRGFISSTKHVVSQANRKASIGNSNENFILNTENCLTIYHLLDQQLYLVVFTSHLDVCKWYYNLFKLRWHPDTWSAFKSDTFPNVKPSVAMQQRFSVVNSSTSTSVSSSENNNKKIFDIFKKK